jgi:hypothetical protein
VGCVGGIESTQNPPPGGVGGGGSGDAAAQAKKLFEDNVHPISLQYCSGCHTAGMPQGNVTAWVSPDLTNAYVTAVGYQALIGDWTPTGAPILTKITNTNKTSDDPHKSIMYTDSEIAKITDWLNKELEARGATGGGTPMGPETPGQVSERLLQEWSGCMTLTNFEAADMRQWGNSQSNEGRCKTCHNLGEQGMIASDTSTPNFFNYITTDKYYMLQYFSVDLSKGVEMATIMVNTRSFEGVGLGLPPHNAHPPFQPDQIDGYQALQNFYQTTMAAKMAAPNGVCGPTQLLN